MTRKGWCKTAQLILDDLSDGCQLQVCWHLWNDEGHCRWPYTHSRVWSPEQGKTLRFPPETIAKRLVDNGYVIEISRSFVKGGCQAYVRSASNVAWESTYRITGDREDCKASALHNLECDLFLAAIRDAQIQRKAIAHLVGRSEAMGKMDTHLEEIIAFGTSTLSGAL